LRLGILGGTFNPIHIGHMRIAEEISEKLELDRVYLIPGALPPHKSQEPIIPFHDRLAMTRMAVRDSPLLEALDLEGRRQGMSYSIETLKEIKRLFKPKPELFFIIGIDAFLEIKTWKDYKQLFRYTNFVVVNRPGFSPEELEPFILSLDVGFQRKGNKTCIISSGSTLINQKATLMDISSTRIREMVAAGKSIRYLVPESVRTYILEKGLYRIHGDS